MYSIGGYEEMARDGVRMSAYAAALQRAVRPGATVVDIGAGTGILSLLACHFGAGRVYAIEPDEAIHVARENAKANGLADRITFIQDLSTNVQLAERADVIVSDLRGVLPLLTHHVPSIVDARERLLANGGVMIPECDRIWVGLAENSANTPPNSEEWDPGDFDLSMPAAEKYISNSMLKKRFCPEQLLTGEGLVGELDYRTVASENFTGRVELPVQRIGKASCIAAWFSTQLLGDIGFTNAPGNPTAIYSMMKFPLLASVDVEIGDTVQVELQATLAGDDYVWRWNTRLTSSAGEATPKADFRQSSFFAQPLSVAGLKKRGDKFVPSLNKTGSVDSFVLGCFAEQQSLGDIAHRICQQFPDQFSTWHSALSHVGRLAERYSH